MIDVLETPALTWLGTPLSYAECFGFITGILCVLLVARQNIWNFPLGIANSALLLLLFLKTRLFADASLQLMFIGLNVRGWWQWAQKVEQEPRRISIATRRQLLGYAAASGVLACLFFAALTLAKGSLPVFDASITALSVVAQWLLNRKTLQNWWWWIAVDIISIPVYVHKQLYLIALLYGVFLLVCVFGLRAWRAELGDARSAPFRHALVIGKFYPPHVGHEYLIRTAADVARQVTVVAMASDVESIPLARRVLWLRELFEARAHVTIVGIVDNVKVDYHSDAIWKQHVDLMKQGVVAAERARSVPAGPVDAVVTSEAYGEELARRFEAAAVCLDRNRELYRVSGTQVRRDPVRAWDLIAPCVHEYLAQRVVIVGAESTGKTTLAAALAAGLRERGAAFRNTLWVEEYGREYTVNKLAVARALAREPELPMEQLQWHSHEFVAIATEQQQREDRLARSGGPVLVCDTDAFATAVWHQRYVGERSTAVEALAIASPPRLGYILTDVHEVPFEQDGIRDGEHIRQWMHDEFAARLGQASVPWMIASGTPEQRIARCLAWIDQQLAEAWHFADLSSCD